MRTLRIHFLNNFHREHTAVLNHIYTLYSPSTYLSYSWKSVLFDHLHQILPPNPTSGNHKSVLFFYEPLSLKHKWPIILLVSSTQHSDSVFLYTSEWSPVSLVTTLFKKTFRDKNSQNQKKFTLFYFSSWKLWKMCVLSLELCTGN